jgi:hypothetical protein
MGGGQDQDQRVALACGGADGGDGGGLEIGGEAGLRRLADHLHMGQVEQRRGVEQVGEGQGWLAKSPAKTAISAGRSRRT